jgi:hypothetical protein
MAPNKYIDKMVSTSEQMFDCKPSTKVSSPLEKGDHPKIDSSELLDKKGIQQYQSLIGASHAMAGPCLSVASILLLPS